MAGIARQTRRAMSVGATHDHWSVRYHAVGLGRPIAHRMAVEAARMLQHLAGLAKQRDRPRGLILPGRFLQRTGRHDDAERKAEQSRETGGASGDQTAARQSRHHAASLAQMDRP